MSYEVVKTNKSTQPNANGSNGAFGVVSLLIACFCSIERILWTKEDTYSAELDDCEMAEILLEDGLEDGAGYNYDINRLVSNYPLSLQGHFTTCLRCQPRLLDLVQRYQRSQQLRDLDQVIDSYWADLGKYPAQEFSEYHAVVRNNLGNALLSRFERDGQPEDLRQAIACYKFAGRLYTSKSDHLSLAAVMNNVGTALQQNAMLEDQPEQTAQAIDYYRRALDVFKQQDRHIHRALVQNNLGNAQLQRFVRYQHADDLEQAVLNYQVALETCQAPHYATHSATLRRNLGAAMANRYLHYKRPADWEQAYTCYEKSLAFFSQDSQFSFDAALAREGLEQLAKFRMRQPRLIPEITYLDKTSMGAFPMYQVNGSYDLGTLRLAGLIEAEATIRWVWKSNERKLSFEPDGSVSHDNWNLYMELQPLLVRSNRLRLSLTLPDSQSQSSTNSWQNNLSHERWTSPWYVVNQTTPIQIELPNLWHLAQCSELHWQIEQTPNSTPFEWVSGYLTWRSLLGKMASSQRHLNRATYLPADDWDFQAVPSNVVQNPTNPRTCFEMINLAEQGIKLEMVSQPLSTDEIKLTLRLVSTGVTAEHDHDWLNRVYEVEIYDQEQQATLAATRFKVEQKQIVTLNPPYQLEDHYSLEFKLRQAEN
jgi:tetratricopeptide (TPR) repeat protein